MFTDNCLTGDFFVLLLVTDPLPIVMVVILSVAQVPSVERMETPVVRDGG